jgi:hypothetical protein
MGFEPFPEWQWRIPEFLNIGVACTDSHLATAAQERVAMIVEDDRAARARSPTRELAERTSRFAQLLRAWAWRPATACSSACPTRSTTPPPSSAA